MEPRIDMKSGGSNNYRRFANWSMFILIVLLGLQYSLPVLAENDYGRPGDVFGYYHYPLLIGSPRQESPVLALRYNRNTMVLGGSPLLEGASSFLIKYQWPWQVGRKSAYKGYGVLGFSYYGIYVGDIPARGRNNEFLGEMSQQLSVAAVTYAYQLTQNIGLGASVNTVLHDFAKLSAGGDNLEDVTGLGFGLDFGISYSPINQVDLVVGIENLLQPRLELDRREESWPTNISFDLGLKFFKDRLGVGVGGTLYDLITNDDDFSDGAEMSQSLRFGLLLNLYRDISLRGCFMSNDEIGGGVDFARGMFSMNYTAVHQENAGVLHRVALAISFGHSRSEKFARLQENIPENLFRRGISLYMEEKYWEAARVFQELVTKFPSSPRADDSFFYMGKSMYSLGFLPVADAIQRRLLKDYRGSEFEARSLLELQRSCQDQGKYSEAETIFRQIESDYRESSAYDGARYHAAQINSMRGENQSVIEQLIGIPPESEYHRFAQYLMVQNYFEMDEIHRAISIGKNLVSLDAGTQAEERLINRTLVTVGHLLYEAKEYDAAIESYDMVVETSPFYEEALMGKAWCLIKLNRNVGARRAANALVNLTKSKIYRHEAQFIEALSLANEGNTNQAIEKLSALIGDCETVEVSESSFKDREQEQLQKIQKLRERMDMFAGELASLLLRAPNEKRNEEMTDVKSKMDAVIKDLRQQEGSLQAFLNTIAIQRADMKIREDAEIEMNRLELLP